MKGFEAPKQPSPEEMAKIEKERALSDAELLKGGAEYKFDEEGNKTLEATDEQVEEVKEGMEKEKGLSEEDIERKIEDMNTDEQTYYAKRMAYLKLLEWNELLLNEGRINKDEYNEVGISIGRDPMEIGDTTEKISKERNGEIVSLVRDQRRLENSKMMQNADSFNKLYKSLRSNLEHKFHPELPEPNHIVDTIEKVRNGELEIDSVTRAGGLRSKVEQLLEKKDEVKTAEQEEQKIDKEKIEGTISISDEKRQEIHEKVMKEEKKRREELRKKMDPKKFSFRNRAEENIDKEKENASKNVESGDYEQEKLDIIYKKLMGAFLDEVKETKSAFYQSSLGNNPEGTEAYELQKRSLAQEKIFPDSLFDNFDRTIKEKILVEDMDSSRMMGDIMYKPDLLKLQEYIKEKDDFSEEELQSIKAALGDLIDDGFKKLFMYNDSGDIKVALTVMGKLSEKSSEFNPKKFGYYKILDRIGTGLASIEFDLETKPNFRFARPGYIALENNLNQLSQILSNIGAKQSLREEK